MRKLLLFLIAAMPGMAHAQTGTFESQPLSTTDTYYVNYTMPGKDVGFDEDNVHYPCIYDTAFGGFWVSGFAYSNKKDSVTSGYFNQYSAKPASGRNGSAKYVVAYGGVTGVKRINSRPWFYNLFITNSTYAYNSMRDGDGFAKKFGGASGNDTDWFKVTIRGYKNGLRFPPDSTDFYLADFRFPNNAQDYIVKDWRQISLSEYRLSDSLTFTLTSSDTGMFGINTPLYFCLDDVTLISEGVAGISFSDVAMISPNPATDFLRLDLKNASVKEAILLDATGRTIASIPVNAQRVMINITTLPPGQYLLKLVANEGTTVTKFTRQ